MRVLISFAIVGALHVIGADAAATILGGWLLIFWTSYLLTQARGNR